MAIGGPFTPAAILDDRGLHVLHMLPLGVESETGEPLWLAVRMRFANWDAFKREIYLLGTLTLALACVVGAAAAIYGVRRSREQALRHERDRAAAASEAKSEFIAFVSHELRTPLQGVIGYADIVRAEPEHPLRRDFLDALAGQGRHLLRMVNDLLDFSAAEAGRLKLERRSFRLRDVFTEVAKAFEPAIREKGLAWGSAEIEEALAAAEWERARRRAHYLENTVLFLELPAITAACHRVAEAARTKNPAAARRALAELARACEAAGQVAPQAETPAAATRE
ncbi:MAG: sensor histidine kinase [Opitutaceae bacterium]